jgi:hypothetical protein
MCAAPSAHSRSREASARPLPPECTAGRQGAGPHHRPLDIARYRSSHAREAQRGVDVEARRSEAAARLRLQILHAPAATRHTHTAGRTG